MDRLPEDILLKYNPDTMQVVRSLYNLDKPGQMDEAVNILETWIKQQEHFMKKDFRKDYLERVIVQLKGSVERAKSQLDKICTLRTMMPKFFKMLNAKEDLKEIQDYAFMVLMPILTNDHHRVFVLKLNEGHMHTERKLFLVEAYSVLINEYIKTHDYCDGVVAICDLRGVHITQLISELNLSDLRQIATICLEGYDSRVKSIHFISSSMAIDLLMKMLKNIFSAKVASRIHVHKTHEDILGFIPQTSLPKDYGGDGMSLDELNVQLLEALSTDENKKYLKEMWSACTDESRRSVPTFNESYLGIAGTFRTLNVD